ncbi:MAG TPA: GNAT family N-acetyltransferase [Dinghuibacter sp.]|uniref:GNAT family N-acetyltransferase n=1 Tax=Dinghuibacter sp. TaxID=2024697 RepID=UPI002CC6265E|nr:GNAT family N-acetyltransferase [Dinghuibacter sp.]HTJ14071.1 GNAT family N-acetyltransferase [Dinghuibacter sp.]
MHIVPVTTPRLASEFIRFPHQHYRNDPQWISPLDDDIRAVFDPKRNSFFSHGVCTRWLLYDGERIIGRIAAFVNYEKAKATHVGGVGFFECIDSQDAAFLLFDTAAAWLRQQGMTAMDGPINFGENEKYWGLLVEGFKPPSLGMNYNPPYYVQLFEKYGFVKQYDQLTNFLDARVPISERFTKISGWVMRKPGYSFKHFSYTGREKFFREFQEIYDDAWSNFENFTPLSLDAIRESFRQMKAIADEKIIWFAYHKDEPIGFVLCLPDANQILKHLHGKMNLWAKLKFLYYRKTTTIDRLRIIVMGCKKKFQNHGIESALIRCLQDEVLPRHTIKGVELAWVGDFNQKMLAIHEATGAITDKVHRTYRFTFA